MPVNHVHLGLGINTITSASSCTILGLTVTTQDWTERCTLESVKLYDSRPRPFPLNFAESSDLFTPSARTMEPLDARELLTLAPMAHTESEFEFP